MGKPFKARPLFHISEAPPSSLQESDCLREKCAVFGVYLPSRSVAPLIYEGLSSQQHRGQEASGITISTGKEFLTHKGQGLVSVVYTKEDIENLSGYIGIGQNRYSTSGDENHLQPITTEKNLVALSHNGTLPETKKLERFLHDKHVEINGLNDSELMQRALEYYVEKGASIEDAIKNAYPLFTGAFSLTILTKDKLVGVRDSHGIRPFSIGKIGDDGYVLSSETCGLDRIKAEQLRDVVPGEMVVFDKDGMHATQLEKGEEKLDIFEIIYFARADSKLYGKSVSEMRREMGRQLVRERKIDADMVIAVPNSSIPAAAGYAQESGIPYEPGALIKDSYTHRTFINPSEIARTKGVRNKFVTIPDVLDGKRVIVVDDSIVRGPTSRELVKMLRDAGAKEVHFVVSSPPVKYPDFYGIATPTQKELIASYKSVDEIKEYIHADSLQYLSLEGTITATGFSKDKFNMSCFTGEYTIDIGDNAKHINFAA